MKSLFLMLCAVAPVAAQTPDRAVASITTEDVMRRINVIAHDSMGGRDTPSPGLDKTAAYIAREFQRFGLKPGGDNGTFIQHYAVLQRVLDTAATALEVGGAKPATLKIGRDINATPFLELPDRGASGPLVVLAGPPSPTDPFGGQSIAGAWVAVLVRPGQTDRTTVRSALVGGAAGILLISHRSDADWAQALGTSLSPTIAVEGGHSDYGPLLEIRDIAAARALGIDSTSFAGDKRVARRVNGVTLSFKAGYQVLSRVNAPNTVGILEGSDPVLRNEYIIYSAHMDHVGTAGKSGGCRAKGADSICNGADDDGSGTVSVIETAEAFSLLQPRPKRSIIFLTVSGEEHGLWGSAYFADHPPVPITSIVADLNTDMIGRNWRDTIVAIGKEHSDLGATLNRVGAAHPELNMKPIDDIWPEESFYTRSDHFNFARKGVPILFFFNGVHPDYHQVSDSPDKIDGEKESRIIKLVFYLGLEVANAAQKPKWNPESYRQIVQQATN